MEIIETRVHPRPDRRKVEQQFLTALAGGAQALFSLVDHANGKISGAARLAREFKGRFSGVQSYRGKTLFSNYFSSFSQATALDVQTLIQGLGTRFPCQHGWVLAASSVSRLLESFQKDSRPIDQNSYLSDECLVYSFGVFGALILKTRAVEASEGTDSGPLAKDEWRYFHIVLSPDETKLTRKGLASISAELDQAYGALSLSIKARGDVPQHNSTQARVTLSPVAKRHFEQLGFRWNKALSEPRVTVFDRLTSAGNVIRVSADAGGHSDLLPYVDAQFISMTYRSPAVPVVHPQVVTSADQLLTLFEQHQPDLAFFEEHVAGRLESVFHRMDENLQRILTEENVRAIIESPSEGVGRVERREAARGAAGCT